MKLIIDLGYFTLKSGIENWSGCQYDAAAAKQGKLEKNLWSNMQQQFHVLSHNSLKLKRYIWVDMDNYWLVLNNIDLTCWT